MNADLTVVGMGNILYRDEGVGVYAARYLQMAYRFAPGIEVVDGALMGFGLMKYFQLQGPPARLIILDALLADDKPGAIYRLSADQLISLGPDMRPTAHEVDAIQLLKLASALGSPPELTLLGIVPADASELAVGLTPELADAFPRYVDAVLAEVRDSGIRAERSRCPSIDDVIGELVTCQP